MSQEQKDIFAAFKNQLAKQQAVAPWTQKANPAQDALTSNALAGNDYFQKGDYSSMPKGMFFNFQQPAEALDQYKKYANVGQGGTYALAQGNSGGRTAATAQQGQFLQDRFARDASQNYQNNIANAASNVQNALGQSSGANLQSQSLDLQGQQVNNNQGQALLGTLGSLANSYINKPGLWGSILGLGGQLGAAAINKF